MARTYWVGALLVGWLGWAAAAVAQPPEGFPEYEMQPGPIEYTPDYPVPPQSPPQLDIPVAVNMPGPCVEGAEVTPPPGEPFWARFEYLHFYLFNRELPPLVTSGSIADPFPGAIGQPNTQTLIGGVRGRFGGEDTNIGDNLQSGMRISGGAWLDPAQTLSLETSFLWLFDRVNSRTEASDAQTGSRLLARPFFNVNAGRHDADPIAVPNVLAGSVKVSLPRELLGAEFNFRNSQPVSVYSLGRFSYLVGFRYLSLDESMEFVESLEEVPGLGAAPNRYSMAETFRTLNDFYGGQVGCGYEARWGPVHMEFLGKLALGATNQSVRAQAVTTVIPTNSPPRVGLNRGLLVQSANAGSRSRTEMAYVPEANINLAYEFNQYVKVTLGYTFLYWSQVLHPEDQVDISVNLQPLQPFDQVGLRRPGPVMRSQDFWTQGLSIGVHLNF